MNTQEEMELLRDKIQHEMDTRGWNRKKLAAHLCVTSSYVSQVLLFRKGPEALVQIANDLGIRCGVRRVVEIYYEADHDGKT